MMMEQWEGAEGGGGGSAKARCPGLWLSDKQQGRKKEGLSILPVQADRQLCAATDA